MSHAKRLGRIGLLCFLFSCSLFGDEVAFIFFGDFGTGEPSQYQVAHGMKTFCAHNHCQFALTLGDNFYPAGVQSATDSAWDSKLVKPYEFLGLTFFPSFGNHDYAGIADAQIQYSKIKAWWKFPKRYYDHKHGSVDFFAIDTEHFDSENQTWLTEKIAKSTAKWKIVYGHHPIYSYGMHGDTPHLIQNLLPILKGKVDFYLCGHDHDKQVLSPVDELNFIVSGTASQTRTVNKGPRTLFSAATLGFSHLGVAGDHAVLKMLRADGSIEYDREFHKTAALSAH